MPLSIPRNGAYRIADVKPSSEPSDHTYEPIIRSRSDNAWIEELQRQQVAAARRHGASWEQIGESLGRSRQSAWEYYTRDARAALEDSAAGAELGEDEAMRVATEEVTRIRRRRRRTGT